MRKTSRTTRSPRARHTFGLPSVAGGMARCFAPSARRCHTIPAPAPLPVPIPPVSSVRLWHRVSVPLTLARHLRVRLRTERERDSAGKTDRSVVESSARVVLTLLVYSRDCCARWQSIRSSVRPSLRPPAAPPQARRPRAVVSRRRFPWWSSTRARSTIVRPRASGAATNAPSGGRAAGIGATCSCDSGVFGGPSLARSLTVICRRYPMTASWSSTASSLARATPTHAGFGVPSQRP